MENKNFIKISLSDVKDNELVQMVKETSDSDALQELENRHSPLCFNIYQKFSGAISSSGHYLPDVVGDKTSTIWKACLSFSPEKQTKFSTWLGNHVTYQCLNVLNKRNIFDSIDNEDIKTRVENEISSIDENRDVIDYCKHIVSNIVDDRTKEIFNLRYFEGNNRSWSEIAEKVNISTQAVINLHDRGLKILKQKLTSQEFYDKL